MNINQFTVYDIESYPNFFLAIFINPDGSFTQFDQTQLEELSDYILDKRLVGFNNHHYDDLLLYAIGIRDVTTAGEAWELTKNLIEGPKSGEPSLRDAYQWKLQSNNWCPQSIDLKRAIFKPGDSLKKLEATYHFQNLEDLPFPPGTVLTEEEKETVARYCENDVAATHRLLELRFDDLKLKQLLTDRYGVDVRSSGNASASESIVRNMYINRKRQTGDAPTVRQLKEYSRIYNDDLLDIGVSNFIPEPVQGFLTFNNIRMQQTYERILNATIPFSGKGKIDKKEINHHISAYGLSFSITAGGFHSEDAVSIVQGNLMDFDVTSFYPSMMIGYGIQPSIYGPQFSEVFSELITQRIDAKSSDDRATDDALKIAINSVYGKLNDKYSTFRDPRSMLMVTVTGQLLLIKLIEMMHEAGIAVLSANTDGVLVQTEKSELATQVATVWEELTGLKLERTDYEKVVRKSVNDYIAISTDGKVKRKGSSFAVGSTTFPKPPSNDIIKDALVAYFVDGTPPSTTINRSTDIRKFINTYTATGNMQSVIDGSIVQNSNRWYHANGSTTTIKRRRQDGSLTTIDTGIWICNRLPEKIPDDLDRERYINKAHKEIEEIEIKSAPPGKNAQMAAVLSQSNLSVIPMVGERNGRGVRYDGSKTWANWEYDFHPNLGLLNGIPNSLYTITVTDPEKIPNDLAILLEDNPSMVICTDDTHPDDVATGEATGSLVYRSNNIELIPTVSRISKFGFTIKGAGTSTVCFGPIEGTDNCYITDGTVTTSTDLDEWLMSV